MSAEESPDLRGRRPPDARMQTENPLPGDFVEGVQKNAEMSGHVFDMRLLEERIPERISKGIPLRTSSIWISIEW